jgi:hypothetical protein
MRCGGVGGTAEKGPQEKTADEREAQEHEAPERHTQHEAAANSEVHAEPAADVQVEPEVHARSRRRKRSLSCRGVSLSCSGVSASKTASPQDAAAASHSEVRAETGGGVTLWGGGGLGTRARCGSDSEVRADAAEVHKVELHDLEPGKLKELDSCVTCFVRHMRLSEYLDIWRLLGTMSAYVSISHTRAHVSGICGCLRVPTHLVPAR